MNKKIIWLIVSCLMVVALVLASCAPAVVEEKEAKVVTKEPEKKVEKVVEKPAVSEPQYGGTIFAFLDMNKNEPPSPDIADGISSSTVWLNLIQDKPLIGDIVKYGPRGTGEYDFHGQGYVPEQYLKGNLLESWEVSREKLIWNVRPGIYWAADNVDWMENRELTAKDVVADLIAFRNAAAGKDFKAMAGDIYAEDKYTVVIEFANFDLTWINVIGYGRWGLISPPEMLAAGADKWENQVGTGPFMFKEHVVGSHFTYQRNLNYWGTTPINGVEYKIPFVDEIKAPIIPDKATQIAALRTGKLDYCVKMLSPYWDSIDKTAPDELQSVKYANTKGNRVVLKNTETDPPLNNREVRQALMVGTDRNAFAELAGIATLPQHFYPIHPWAGDLLYTPLEELPAEIRLLYEYNPTKAKQMLADAGYPDGFTMTYYTMSTPVYVDQGELLKDQWSKIGVDIDIVVWEASAWFKHSNEKTYIDSIIGSGSIGNSLKVLKEYVTGAYRNYPVYSDSYYDELMSRVSKELDVVERSRLMKEACLYLLNEAVVIPLSLEAEANYWWPWVKNYYGETYDQDTNRFGALRYVWLDQVMKAEMGY